MPENQGPLPRDMLELMVAYGFLPPGALRVREPAPITRPAGRAAALGFVSVRPRSGQSTLILGLTQVWSSRGRRVLLVDLDPGEELARLLRGGGRNAGEASLLHAIRSGRCVRPAPTLMPDVDIVTGGGAATWEVDQLPVELRKQPERLGEALADAEGIYDRILIDCPPAPGALLDAVLRCVDRVVPVAACDDLTARSPVWSRLDRPGAAPLLGMALSRWKPGGTLDGDWFARTYEGDAVVCLDTVIPEIEGLRDAWDVVGGAAGLPLDRVFEALAAEIDQRLETA